VGVDPASVARRVALGHAGVFEAAITDQLAVRSAVDAMVDLLEEDPVQARVDLGPRA
jgi:predicted nucleotidyltransferase